MYQLHHSFQQGGRITAQFSGPGAWSCLTQTWALGLVLHFFFAQVQIKWILKPHHFSLATKEQMRRELSSNLKEYFTLQSTIPEVMRCLVIPVALHKFKTAFKKMYLLTVFCSDPNTKCIPCERHAWEDNGTFNCTATWAGLMEIQISSDLFKMSIGAPETLLATSA